LNVRKFLPLSFLCSLCRCKQRLREIGDDVVDVLDANAEPYHLRTYACLFLLLWRHLAMRGGRWMTGECLGVAEIDEALDQFQRVVELLARLEAAADAERD